MALEEWVASFPATANVKAILLQILFQTTRRPQHMIQTRVSDTRIPKPQNIAQPIRRTIQAGPMCRFVRDKTFFCMALWREICSQIWLWCDTLQCVVVFGWFETGERQGKTLLWPIHGFSSAHQIVEHLNLLHHHHHQSSPHSSSR